jgi:uncharacterized oxidoreductase
MIDALRRVTTDPEDFFRMTGNLLPLGEDVGYKGYGLGLAVDVLAGILGRAGHSRAQPPAYNNGMFMLVVDIGRFLPLQEFTAALGSLITYVKNCPPGAAREGIDYPGARAARTARYRRRHGIAIDEETWHRLRTIAQERGVQVPDSV